MSRSKPTTRATSRFGVEYLDDESIATPATYLNAKNATEQALAQEVPRKYRLRLRNPTVGDDDPQRIELHDARHWQHMNSLTRDRAIFGALFASPFDRELTEQRIAETNVFQHVQQMPIENGVEYYFRYPKMREYEPFKFYNGMLRSAVLKQTALSVMVDASTFTRWSDALRRSHPVLWSDPNQPDGDVFGIFMRRFDALYDADGLPVSIKNRERDTPMRRMQNSVCVEISSTHNALSNPRKVYAFVEIANKPIENERVLVPASILCDLADKPLQTVDDMLTFMKSRVVMRPVLAPPAARLELVVIRMDKDFDKTTFDVADTLK